MCVCVTSLLGVVLMSNLPGFLPSSIESAVMNGFFV